MSIQLEVISGPHEGLAFEFDEHDTFVVGRGPKAHFQLPAKDRYFSRIHFMIEVNPPACRLMDMGSTNGTYVNKAKVQTSDLKDGDLISGGDTVLQLRILTPPEPETDNPETPAPDLAKTPTAPVQVPRSVMRAGRAARSTPRSASSSPPPKQVPPAPSSEPVLLPVAEPILEPEPAADNTRCRACRKLLSKSTSQSVSEELVQQFPMICRACLVELETQEQPLADYRLVRELGRGGMGVVTLGIEVATGLPRAVKTVIPAVAGSQADIDRFLRESRVLESLQHENIVRYHDMGETNNLLYFAMEYIPGMNAEDFAKGKGPLSSKMAVTITCQLLRALQHAHQSGFVHRDIKPSNVLLGKKKSALIVKLADFGLSKVYNDSRLSGLTMTGELRCSVPFVAPEQILNYRDSQPHSDIYSAAATLYYLLTNKYIFEFPTRMDQRLMAILQGEPVPVQERVSGIPDSLARIIHQGLHKEPSHRFADAIEFEQALLDILEEMP